MADMIAIPDFSAGAMENWGLITYREASLLYQEGVTPSSRKQWIVETITHELAHQVTARNSIMCYDKHNYNKYSAIMKISFVSTLLYCVFLCSL